MLNLPQALSGARVFPCLPGDKLPALNYGWQSRATNDNAQIEQWSRDMDNLNWGVAAGPSGLFVIDIDPQGMATWQSMLDGNAALCEAVEKSFTVRTPRGGLHHYFRGHGPSTVSDIAEGIDTRGGYLDEATGRWKSIGYVVLPGSVTVAGPKTVDGAYEYLGGDIFDMPPAVQAIVPERKKGAMLGLPRDPSKDQPRNVQWAKDLIANYVAEGRVSVEGKGGNNTLYQVAASILDKAISPATAYELLDELWNPHCVPPWDDWELERVIANAASYGDETEGGSKGFEDNASAFEKFAGTDAGEDSPQPAHAERRRERIQWIDDYAAGVKDPVWLLPGILPATGTGMLFGPSGSYKSFIALDWASCLAHGHTGQWGAPPVCNDVVYFAGEAPIGTAKHRRPAWLEWSGIDTAHRLAIFPRVPHLSDGDAWNGIKSDISEMGITPRLIVIDTLTRLLTGFDENSTKDATLATGFLEDLARYYECLVLVVHHTGKDESRGARGSSAFFANMDTVLSTQKKGHGAMLKVKKHKDADAPEEGIYLGVKPVKNSIVLEKGAKPEDVDSTKSNKVSWSDPGELTKLIAKQGGRISNAILCQEIASGLGIEKSKVNSELRRREDIKWLREGDYWRLPATDLDFDL